jgi:hypothetical protein
MRNACLLLLFSLSIACNRKENAKPSPSPTSATVEREERAPKSAKRSNVGGVRAVEALRRLSAAVGATPEEPWERQEDGMYVQRQPDGSELRVSGQPSERIRPDVYTPVEAMKDQPELVRSTQENVGRVDGCLDPLRGHKITKTIEWSVILHVEGDGITTRVVDVEVDDAWWPSFFTADVKDCYLEQFRNKSWESDHVGLTKIQYPFCLTPPATAEQGV